MAQSTRSQRGAQQPPAGQRRRGEGGRQRQVGGRGPAGRGPGGGGGRGPGGGGSGGRGPAPASNRWLRVGIPVFVVVAVVVALVVVKLAGGGSSSNAGGNTSPGVDRQLASSAVVNAVSGVPASVFDKVGTPSGLTPPIKISKAPALTSAGKPEILYMGDEWCPYCAAERWALVTALSRFGTFTNLHTTLSSATDVDPDTNTLSFAGTDYTSQYLTFVGVELQNRNRSPLMTATSEQNKLIQTYDNVPYVNSNSAGAVPFIDFGNQFLISGASYDPQILSGLTHEQIAAQLANPGSNVAQAILGTANMISATVCQLTNGQPATVCQSAGVKAGAALLNKSK